MNEISMLRPQCHAILQSLLKFMNKLGRSRDMDHTQRLVSTEASNIDDKAERTTAKLIICRSKRPVPTELLIVDGGGVCVFFFFFLI